MTASLFQPEFAYISAPQRVVFGPDAQDHVAAEITALGRKRALVLTTPEQSAAGKGLLAALGTLGAGHCADATMHTPVEVTERVLVVVQDLQADCLVAIGGGSTTGLSKALALRTGMPQIVIPTSFAGSEATPILGQTDGGRKTTLTDPRVRPTVILYDVALVRTLPPHMLVASGMNAIAHAVEGLYARDRNPISSMMAIEGIKALASALPKLTSGAPTDHDWGEALYGAWLCGTVLGQVGMALHHKLCHALGGGFNLPHAETHAVILPHAVAYTEAAVPDLLRPVAAIFGTKTAYEGLTAFAQQIGAPTRLSAFGLTEADLPRALDLATANPYWNPRAVEPEPLAALLARALVGDPAQP
ncbi:MAG: tfdF [Cypionkella sp.]|uniref:maleylacetate reductase n=1 Tax=Cypionkella sp. TaxID=2811411 RepID=UPI00262835F0|nr:maleylacetate reductase [Cypionkella sp.]MDB5659957.1 tfdF [Cypionkella sp.]